MLPSKTEHTYIEGRAPVLACCTIATVAVNHTCNSLYRRYLGGRPRCAFGGLPSARAPPPVSAGIVALVASSAPPDAFTASCNLLRPFITSSGAFRLCATSCDERCVRAPRNGEPCATESKSVGAVVRKTFRTPTISPSSPSPTSNANGASPIAPYPTVRDE